MISNHHLLLTLVQAIVVLRGVADLDYVLNDDTYVRVTRAIRVSHIACE